VIAKSGVARVHPRPKDDLVNLPIEFAATVVGGQHATVDRDGFVGYLFGMAARPDGSEGCLIVQRADEPVPEWQPYCLVWGEQEGTTYGGVCRAEVTDGQVLFELLRHNAAELGTPTRFRIVFPPRHTEEVRAGLRRTLGDTVVP
jgi:hypothetical protein